MLAATFGSQTAPVKGMVPGLHCIVEDRDIVGSSGGLADTFLNESSARAVPAISPFTVST
ncbi:MAG: hypothetical protein WBX11_02670 [Thiobacillaceae bacterium]